jgi:hypothetical protein
MRDRDGKPVTAGQMGKAGNAMWWGIDVRLFARLDLQVFRSLMRRVRITHPVSGGGRCPDGLSSHLSTIIEHRMVIPRIRFATRFPAR